jgi:hypothetical protein
MDKRGPGFSDSLKELMDRLRCMESILKHHLPNLDLDIGSLRRTCDSLSSRTPRPDQNETTAGSFEPPADVQPSDRPGIEDENCTIDNVDGTTVRTFLVNFSTSSGNANLKSRPTDYSGEFSHWNFSMHIKRNIDELMAKSNVPVRNYP